jgi:hypothetical protein
MAPELQLGSKRRLEQSVPDLFVAEACALGGTSYADSAIFGLRRVESGARARYYQRGDHNREFRYETSVLH